ncbi:MAG: SDR family NAD(P)-dependent oxidoreductase [Bacteroidetes bacterium]|nr:SDR family NAD(P)-dependent oxidoreductase [Bacteroidota bacterium]MCL1968153.1 SDR family NAD(P)-dependent oxidoreductase [Bacteroidota bacterium]
MIKKTAIITGGAGSMGKEITKAVAKAGFTTIMADLPRKEAEQACSKIKEETNGEVVFFPVDLASADSIFSFVEKVKNDYGQIDLLINNAGALYPKKKDVEGKWDYTLMVNYFGHYLLTNKLLSSFCEGARIVNVCSLTYQYGKIKPQLFECGRNSWVQQMYNYFNSKLALLYFTLDLTEQLKEKQITANCSDPGIVGTNIIAMNNKTFDKICDVFARPFMKSPKKGAQTAIYLALNESAGKITGGYFKNVKQVSILPRVLQSNEREILRQLTADLLREKNIML